jgi:dTMP kinase
VICDRFAASSVAYQGFGRELGREIVEVANEVATRALVPDLTILLDVPPAEGLARRAGQGARNRFDREAVAFHERVRKGFLELAEESPDAWRVIDASKPLADVVRACTNVIEAEFAALRQPR